MEVLPKICGVDGDKSTLQSQWEQLRDKLPKIKKETLPANEFFKEKRKKYPPKPNQTTTPDDEQKYLNPSDFEKAMPLGDTHDLKVITFALNRYVPGGSGSQTIDEIHAWELDVFFEWLCGDEPYDQEVGIYLHCLPGESYYMPDFF